MDKIFQRLDVKFAGDATAPGSFSGYGAVFGNVDLGGDVIVKGAFRDTLRDLKKAGRTVKMLLQHGFGFNSEDEIPIGVWTNLEEDDHGLKVEGQLFALDTQKGKYIHQGMQAGVLDGLSIGYRAKEVVNGTKPGEPRRTLKRVDLMEISVVTFPMNEKARATGVKAADRFPSITHFEAFLRDEGGLSLTQAKAIASAGFKAASGLRDEDDADAADLIDRFKRLRA